ncbi:MAG: tRNA (adenosine(37)-N6)-threonylcarbamoyltransferase complex dimerization subunit type 1 TsaB, partial [Bacillota bacterium]
MSPLTLGIETSCDDTCAAVVDGDSRVLASVVSSQTELHRRYGGVVPELASRSHSRNMIPVLDAALDESGVSPGDLDLIAVTRGPGLVGSLLVGLMAAKGLAWDLDVPLVGVNHLAAHMWAAALDADLVEGESNLWAYEIDTKDTIEESKKEIREESMNRRRDVSAPTQTARPIDHGPLS